MKDENSVTADTRLNDVNHGLDLTVTDNFDWRSKVIGVNVDGTPLITGQYTLST
ncbi:hemoblobin-interacting domain-containing protein [Brevibacillus centrosporus]